MADSQISLTEDELQQLEALGIDPAGSVEFWARELRESARLRAGGLPSSAEPVSAEDEAALRKYGI